RRGPGGRTSKSEAVTARHRRAGTHAHIVRVRGRDAEAVYERLIPRAAVVVAGDQRRRIGAAIKLEHRIGQRRRPAPRCSQGENVTRLHGPDLEVDRKSTRLNSSHRTISYAVFCLKKKKNKNLIL